jgi:RNase P/RNase MRP subunit p29
MSLNNSRRMQTLAHLGWLMTLITLVAACSSGSVITPSTPPTSTLRGTVSGLNASGLVLANESQPVTVSSGARSFTFGSVLTSGSAYAVTVQTQPAGQLCTVSNGSGTASTANVANVVVACSEQAYSLGGTVSGLISSGLVLATGSDTVSVAPSATTFTFATPVANGSGYSVTVKAQPTGLGCAVTKGTGTMSAGNVNSVLISCTDQPFSLGGSISGLTTSGLVLANGSDTLDVTANATNFTMPTAVSFGSAYAVTVHTPPTGLSCTVTHGSSTMPAAAVTNVAVACADQTYSLGGTISGLTASGLVLANGTDTLTAAANATSFTMPTAVAYGSTYAVTVQTQPTGLTCTASNAMGPMPAAPVANVAITCALTTYTIGGSISDLTASGLVLANGTDTLDVAANAAMFTMPTAVTSGSIYDVTVQTQPAAQLCTLSDGSGSVATIDVTTVAVSCGSNVVSYTTSGPYSWTVPDGVTSIQVVATGGGGGGGTNGGIGSRGGNGGVVTATLGVTPGSTLTLFVGGAGGGSGGNGNTGGGGGSSNFNAGPGNQIIAGGGGGAGAGSGGPASGGNGGGNGTGSGSNGNAGNPSSGKGGSGGIGGAGGPASAEFPGGPPMPFGSGAAGGNGNGGPGGAGGNSGAGGAGSGTGTGGAGGNACCGGGGGGGYGGGGGAGSGPSADGGGGGGGSIGPLGTTFTVGTNGGAVSANGGNGSIVITTNP